MLDDLPSPVDTDAQEVAWLLDQGAGGFPWGYSKAMLTSRSAEWTRVQHVGSGFTVGNFETEEAHAFLKRMVSVWIEDEDGVAKVADRLGYFPLALASAAGCASKYELNTRQYLDELGKKKSSL